MKQIEEQNRLRKQQQDEEEELARLRKLKELEDERLRQQKEAERGERQKKRDEEERTKRDEELQRQREEEDRIDRETGIENSEEIREQRVDETLSRSQVASHDKFIINNVKANLITTDQSLHSFSTKSMTNEQRDNMLRNVLGVFGAILFIIFIFAMVKTFFFTSPIHAPIPGAMDIAHGEGKSLSVQNDTIGNNSSVSILTHTDNSMNPSVGTTAQKDNHLSQTIDSSNKINIKSHEDQSATSKAHKTFSANRITPSIALPPQSQNQETSKALIDETSLNIQTAHPIGIDLPQSKQAPLMPFETRKEQSKIITDFPKQDPRIDPPNISKKLFKERNEKFDTLERKINKPFQNNSQSTIDNQTLPNSKAPQFPFSKIHTATTSGGAERVRDIYHLHKFKTPHHIVIPHKVIIPNHAIFNHHILYSPSNSGHHEKSIRHSEGVLNSFVRGEDRFNRYKNLQSMFGGQSGTETEDEHEPVRFSEDELSITQKYERPSKADFKKMIKRSRANFKVISKSKEKRAARKLKSLAIPVTVEGEASPHEQVQITTIELQDGLI
jgi:hypothetical protein